MREKGNENEGRARKGGRGEAAARATVVAAWRVVASRVGALAWRVGVVASMFVCGAGLAGCSGETARDARPDVIFLTMDTTRADRLGVYGHRAALTPNLDRIARQGALVENAISPVPLTLPAHASILTGTLPAYHGVHDNGFEVLSDEANETLAEILGTKGYRTLAVIGAFVLDRRFGLDQGFDEYEDDPRELYHAGTFHGARDAEAVTNRALELVESSPRSAPLFLWAHYFDPHAPFLAPAPYGQLVSEPGELGAYDAEVAYTDAHVGRLLAGIADSRGGRDRLVVVVGDHGEGLRTPHAELSHGIFLYDEAIRVPLLFADTAGRVPGGAIVSSTVGLVDVVPTVLDYVEVDAPAAVQGRSLLPFDSMPDPEGLAVVAETRMPLHYYGWSPLHTIRTDRWKLVLAPRPELYDLIVDPSESVDRFDAQPERAADLEARLRETLEASREARAARGGGESVSLTESDRQKLSALGYLTPGRSTDPGSDKTVLVGERDPKDLYEVHEAISSGAAAQMEGKTDEAIARLEEALRRDPQNAYGLRMLGQCLEAKGDYEGALERYIAAAALPTVSHDVHYETGACYERLADQARQRGDRRAAVAAMGHAKRAYARAIEAFPADHFSMTRLGLVSARDGSTDGREEAEDWLRRAIDSAPRYPDAYLALAQLLLSQNRAKDARVVLDAAIHDAGGVTTDTDFLLGECNRLLGRNAKALEYYRRAADEHDGARARVSELESR